MSAPQEIAREAAAKAMPMFSMTRDSRLETEQNLAALILSAAARIVRESGVEKALEFYGFDDNYRMNGYLDPTSHNFRGSITAKTALAKLRAIQDQRP